MQILDRKDSPLDQGYYRTISPAYREYLIQGGLRIHDLPNNRYGWIKNVFGLFQVAKFERVDEEPNIEKLKKDGFKHGIVIWVPYTIKEKPAGWRNLLLNSHFTTTGYSVLEPEYYKKWKERARRARKKFLDNKDMRIEVIESHTFQKYYQDFGINKSYKSSFIKYHSKISSVDKKGDITNIVCFGPDNKVMAGLSVIDYNGTSSAHLVAFLTKEGKKTHAGTGVIDYWFKMSLEKGLKYINFDHLRDKYMTADQQGYTTFKENFMDYKVIYEEAYFKFV